MKISCTVCEVAEATVLCCADEAALCAVCDVKVHAANKLASKHQKVPLSNSVSQMPKCDICQEMVGYFFCLEDRALLCRKCDVAIHTANPYVSSHQRFLLTGVRVGLESSEPGSSSSVSKSTSVEKEATDAETASISEQTMPVPADRQYRSHPVQTGAGKNITPSKRRVPDSIDVKFPKLDPVLSSLAGDENSHSRMAIIADRSATGSIPPWHMDEFLGISDIGQHYFGYPDNGTSKADSGKLGESDSSLFLRPSEEEPDPDEYLGQVPDITTRVSKIPSPPTASGLYWPRSSSFVWENSGTFSVPEIHQLSSSTHSSNWCPK